MAFRTTIKNRGDLTTEHIAGEESEFVIETTKFINSQQQTCNNFTELRGISTKSQIVNVIGTGSFERQTYVAQVDDNLNTVITSDNLFAYVRYPSTIRTILHDGTSVAVSGVRGGRGARVGVVDGQALVFADNTILELQFDTPGATADVRGENGEYCTFSRASAAFLSVNGVETTATSGQARICDDGVIVEPAATNWCFNSANLAASTWIDIDTNAQSTATPGQLAPNGTNTAFLLNSATAGHYVGIFEWHTEDDPFIAPQTISIWAKSATGALRYMRISENNSTSHYVIFDLVLQRVITNYGTGTIGHVELDANGYARYSAVIAGNATNRIVYWFSADGTNWDGGAGGNGGVYLWWPQAEAGTCATSRVVGTRAADSLSVQIPPLGDNWSVEIVAKPIGGDWKRASAVQGGDVLISLGVVDAANTFRLIATNGGTDGRAYLNVVDQANTARTTTQYCYSSTARYGMRRFVVTSALDQEQKVPTFLVDGVPSNYSTGAGAGLGVIFPATATGFRLWIGCDSAGAAGGFIIRSVIVRRQPTCPAEPFGAALAPYNGHSRGHFTRGQCIAFMGDSNTASVQSTTSDPYPRIVCKALGCADHNYAIGGKDVNDALTRYRWDASLYPYDTVCVMIGTNDLNGGADYRETFRNLQLLVASISATGARAIVGTIVPLAAFAAAATAYNALIRATFPAADVVDCYAAVNDPGNPGHIAAAYATGDGLHINLAGHTALAVLWSAAITA